MPQGWTVHGAGRRRDYLYFITAGIVSRFYVTENGASAELAITGNEGVLGVAWILGGESSLGQSVVVSAGHAYRVRTDLLKNDLEHDGPLLQLLLRYAQALIAQTGQMAVCNRHHPLKQRFCRWILSCLDRVPSNEIAVTHELMAQMLGVRREGVSDAAGKLQREGLISCHRGQIAVLDRRRLEAQACECYAVVKREYDRLLYPENTTRNGSVRGASRQHRTYC